ncbi:hypothetical protein ACRAWD_10595 [Caulobacter segnis]
MLDSGTTTLQIARFLPDEEDITVVTNDFDVLSVLNQKRRIKIVMLGGELRRRNMAFTAAQTVAALDDLLLEQAVPGGRRPSTSRRGITTHHEPEGATEPQDGRDGARGDRRQRRLQVRQGLPAPHHRGWRSWMR